MPPKGASGPQEGKYDQFNDEASNYFQVADLNDADVLVYPHNAQTDPEGARLVSEMARRRGLGAVFTSWGDADIPVQVPYGTVYRHSLNARTRFKNELAMPAFCADPLDDFGGMTLTREKTLYPSVAFCGFVSNPLMRSIYRMSGRKEKAAGLTLRSQVLRSFRHPDVRTDFIRRNSFFAGTQSRFHHDADAQATVWQEFLHNVLDSDYTICVRGTGNFSYRFYEVLAAGRIPVFINTDCVLPFEDEIDWRRHCVWIEKDELADAAEIVAFFHASLSNDEFVALQMENRALWENRLSPLAFYRSALANAAAVSDFGAYQANHLPETTPRRPVRQLVSAMS
ncbi:MAG: glycosyltransferase family 47 protein [Planctomycetota bacterium]|nr:glycosyltransferase family 47 protein [Planctomycetota bacterium]